MVLLNKFILHNKKKINVWSCKFFSMILHRRHSTHLYFCHLSKQISKNYRKEFIGTRTVVLSRLVESKWSLFPVQILRSSTPLPGPHCYNKPISTFYSNVDIADHIRPFLTVQVASLIRQQVDPGLGNSKSNKLLLCIQVTNTSPPNQKSIYTQHKTVIIKFKIFRKK